MSDRPVPRPDFGLYDPNYQGNILRYRFFSSSALGLALLYTYYFLSSFIVIIKLPLTSLFFNVIVLLVESAIGYYSIFLVWHLAKGFAPVDSELSPVITKQDLEQGTVPFVSILLSSYKEPLSVVSQSLRAAKDLNYPKNKYEVAIVEDGAEDDTVRQFCKENGILHLQRGNRRGFKAGAVNFALPKLQGEYVLFIDADHIVEPNIVSNCLLAWRKGTIGVQTRVDFVNMLTFLTTVSAFLQIQFFSLFERGRRSSGSAVFAGGGALFHREKLIAEGGMNPLTIADDTDTSFILRSRGHRIEYIDTVGVWALVPWDPLHLIRQVWRWLTGITRSFRARAIQMLTGQSTMYTKLDHFSTGLFPTLAILGWLLGFVILGMIWGDISIVRANSVFGLPIMGIIPSLATSASVVAGVLALVFDDDRILYRRKPFVEKTGSLLGFYFLLVAAQPLLLGAILKGLFGIHVKFNRTPKEKDPNDSGLARIKLQYFIYAIIIFIIGIIFAYFALTLNLADPRSFTLLFGAYAGVVPLVVVLLWYWKLESYLDAVGDISALEFLEDITKKDLDLSM